MFSVLVRITAPVLVLALSVYLAWGIVSNRPEARVRAPPVTRIVVDAQRLGVSDYPVLLSTQGTVRAPSEIAVVPQVGGELIEVTESFRDGAYFEKGQVLARIDPRDYEIAVTVAEAERARAQAALQEEQARAQIAEREWRELDRRRQAADLALRKPQVAAAEAAVAAADAQLAKARLSLQRTRIVAPFTGRVLDRSGTLGQYVTPGTVLGHLFATDYFEVRLPVTDRQLAFLAPGVFEPESIGPRVWLHARVGARAYHWQGVITRSAGAIDVESRQLFLIARIDAPYRPDPEQPDRPLLQVGQFVSATIEGVVLYDRIVVPRGALADDDQLNLVDRQGRLLRQSVDVLWRDGESVVIDDTGFRERAPWLVLNPLPGILSGTPLTVRVDGVALAFDDASAESSAATPTQPSVP